MYREISIDYLIVQEKKKTYYIVLLSNSSTLNNGPEDDVFNFIFRLCLSFNSSIYQVAGLENLASADPHSRLWQPEGQYMAEPSYVCRYVPKHLAPQNTHCCL
jgi:hypothetical protein